MGEVLKRNINIPIWLLGILVTIIMAIFSWGLATASSSATIKSKVENTEKIIEELKLVDKQLQADKADKATIDNVYKALERIETKLDIHISK
jgi:hypothetical protein